MAEPRITEQAGAELDWPYTVPTALVQRTVDVAAIEQIEADHENWLPYQHLRIQALLKHAAEHNPWWAERLKGKTADEWLADWPSLPVLSRVELQASAQAVPEPKMPDSMEGLAEVATRGTTGEPVVLLQPEQVNRLVGHQLHADHARHGRNLGHIRAMIGPLLADVRDEFVVVPAVLELNELPLAVRNDSRFTPVQHLAWLKHHQVQQLTCSTPFLLQLLDAAAELSEAERPRLLHICIAGAQFSEQRREQAHALLGARVFDRYIAEEVGFVASQCTASANLHVATSHVAVEVVDADAKPVAPGNSGRVLVTALHNWAHPVLRYALADTATWHPICPGCQAAIPTLSNVQRA